MKTISMRLERCVGCKSCELACSREHTSAKNIADGKTKMALPRIKVQFGYPDEAAKAGGKRSRGTPIPVRCRHCEDPKCVSACMAGALEKAEDGTVVHNEDKCVGCWMCIMACPYGVISRDTEAGKIVKCDMCPDRLTPACVASCKAGAMYIQWDEVEAPRPTLEEVLEG